MCLVVMLTGQMKSDPGPLQDGGNNLHLKVSIKDRVQQWNVLRIRNLRTDIRPKRSEGHTEV
jgi:hypothetical protein